MPLVALTVHPSVVAVLMIAVVICPSPFAILTLHGSFAYGSSVTILTLVDILTTFQLSSHALTCMVNCEPAVLSVIPPPLPVGLPGSKLSPGIITSSLVAEEGLTVNKALVYSKYPVAEACRVC